MRHLVLLALLATGAAACRDAAAPVEDGIPAPSLSGAAHDLNLRKERESLIRAGNQVSGAIGRRGVAAGLGDFLARNVLFLAPRSPTLQGREAAVEWLSTNPIAPSAIEWEVLAADVSNDGSQGFTWTGGSFTADLGSGVTEFPAFFLIYWRRGPSDGWRIASIVFNVGGPQTAPIPPGFGTPPRRTRPDFPPASRQTLLDIDARFSAASVRLGSGPAFERFAAPNAMATGPEGFIFGPEAIGQAFSGPPGDTVSWIPRFAEVAESGDLGFTVGDATFDVQAGTFFSKYITVWQKQDNGRWRYVADLGNSRPGP